MSGFSRLDYCPLATVCLLAAVCGCRMMDRPGLPFQEKESLMDVTSSEQAIRTLRAGEDLSELADGTSGVMLVDFYADWCGPCRKQSKVLHDVQEFASDHNAQIVKVNIDEHRDLAREYRVSSLPTLLTLKDGAVQDKKIGFADRDQVEAMLR